MTRGIARFNNPPTIAERIQAGEPHLPDIFTDQIKSDIKKFYPITGRGINAVGESRAVAFTAEIITEARWAISELDEVDLQLKKKDVLAEANHLLTTLKRCRTELRRLSPDFDRILVT